MKPTNSLINLDKAIKKFAVIQLVLLLLYLLFSIWDWRILSLAGIYLGMSLYLWLKSKELGTKSKKIIFSITALIYFTLSVFGLAIDRFASMNMHFENTFADLNINLLPFLVIAFSLIDFKALFSKSTSKENYTPKLSEHQKAKLKSKFESQSVEVLEQNLNDDKLSLEAKMIMKSVLEERLDIEVNNDVQE